MNMLRYLLLVVGLLGAWGSPARGQEIEVTLLGTGDPTPRIDRYPTPRIDRFGPSTLVETGGVAVLFDAGRGVMQRLYQLGVSTADLDGVFLTHLHSDHVVGLVDLWLTGWVVDRREEPLWVYGPVGTRALVEHLQGAFTLDVETRTAEAHRSRDGIGIEVVEIEDGFVWERDGVAVRAFAVDHRPVEPAFGFRVDSGGRGLALSGDTRYSESLIRHAAGVDLLIHEVAEAPEAFKAEHPDLPRLAHHTQAEDAGRVFAAVSPELAVYSHLVLVGGFEASDLVPLTRRTYDGPVIVGEDLMRIAIGDSVSVREWAGVGAE